MNASSSSTRLKRMARPEATCSTRPSAAAPPIAVPEAHWTTNAPVRGSGRRVGLDTGSPAC